VAGQMADGRLHLRTEFTVVQASDSSNCRYLCTVQATMFIVTLWDLRRSPMKELWSHNNVAQASFGANNSLATSHLSGEINIWSISEQVVLNTILNMNGIHQIFTSDHHLLAVKNQQPKMWKWTSSMPPVDTGRLGPIDGACFSPNGQFVVSIVGRGVQLLTMQQGPPGDLKKIQPDHTHPVSRLLVSGDSTVIAAVSSHCVDLWWTDNVENPAKELRLLEGMSEPENIFNSIVCAAFSLDSSHIAVGCFLGQVILLARRELFQGASPLPRSGHTL
jgi:WD40 repeat protein